MNCEHRIGKEQAANQSGRKVIVYGPMAEGRDICQIAIDEQQPTPFCPYPNETTETCPIVIRRRE
jgi:hypothetical protein